ncbi:MAG TPA: primosomal protein N' [Chloroflexi bacterium]|nr:primosomal protein N' [Chloroflexota bacterium]
MSQLTFAEIVVFSPIDGQADSTFTYHLPPVTEDRTLARTLAPGHLVIVPFGPRRLYGIVVARTDAPPPEVETRPVESLVDAEPVLTSCQIALARWMSREYLTPLWRCFLLMLPPGLVGHADVQVELAGEADPRDIYTEAQEQLVTVLDAKGQLLGRQLDRLLPRQHWRRAASQLDRRGIVVKSHLLTPPRARPKQVQTARLALTDDDPSLMEAALEGLRSEVYPHIIQFLREEGGPVDVSWIYAETGCQRYHLNKLEERGVLAFDTEEVWRDPLADETFVPDTPPPLTSDQQAVWETVQAHIARPGSPTDPAPVILLQGVTGSGKTEIYLRAVAEVIERGQQAIVLVPEISLTPQTVHRFGARFGARSGGRPTGRVAVLHSGLSDGERYDTWRCARLGQIDVVVGPRSALFIPLPDLGLIVLDEEHDDSYKQSAPAPRYHARDAARQLAHLTGASLILGSATPSLETYHRAALGQITHLEMPRRIMGHARRLAELQARYQPQPQAQPQESITYRALPGEASDGRYAPLPPVQIVDLRAELRAGNRSIFSRALQKAIDETLERGEQAILFLNRRGTATFVLCRDCGYVPQCPACDVPLTYHGPGAELVCHHCNHRQREPARCPECGGRRIRYFGLGTERVEKAVHQRWSGIRTLRWDSDTARNHAAHATIMHLFSAGLAQILVGTQMIAKGLDLPLVTTVGVISADTALNLPDFRAAERTFQLLAQVAGRAGRSILGGRVIVQTYHPEHYAITSAAAHDYERFAARELAFRREHGYPPYRRLVKLVYADEQLSRARDQAQALAQTIRQEMARRGLDEDDLIGPVPPFFDRLRGRYRWQILLRVADPADLLREVVIPPGWRVDVDPSDVL